MHSLAYGLGLTDANSPTYLFWSGFGATLIGSLRDIVLLFGAFHVGRIWHRPVEHHHHYHGAD